MADWHDNFLWGTAAALFAAIYVLFYRHGRNHVEPAQIAEQNNIINALKKDVQFRDNCAEIVKRQDGQHKQTHEMLVRVLDKLDQL